MLSGGVAAPACGHSCCCTSADEIDAIGTKRYESQSGGEREIQRTMLELLNQMDGFDSMGDVKVCVAPWSILISGCLVGLASFHALS